MKNVVVKLGLLAVCLSGLQACGTDFSDPQDVAEGFMRLSLERKNALVYKKFLSADSKEAMTESEYFASLPEEKYKILGINSFVLPKDAMSATYARVKVKYTILDEADTVKGQLYVTLRNEDGKWKAVAVPSLIDVASELVDKGNYLEARKIYERIITINPYHAAAYSNLAWCYLCDDSLPYDEWEEGILSNVRQALALEEDSPAGYNVLATYYSIDDVDLAISTYERGIDYCTENPPYKVPLLGNLSILYMSLAEDEEAEQCLRQAIKIDPESEFITYLYGNLMYNQKNFEKAVEYYKKALPGKELNNGQKSLLYFYYADSCVHVKDLKSAQEYINKAINLDPDVESYKELSIKISDLLNDKK